MDENTAHRLKGRFLKAGHLIGLFLAMTIICLPGVWIVLSSLRPTVEIMAKPPVWIPRELSFDAYVAMFSGVGQGGIPVLEYFRNSLIISVTSTVIALAVGMAGGYAFARYRFRGKSAIFLGFMLTRTVPGIALSLPLFFVYAKIGIIDTHFGLILAYVALNVPFTVWLRFRYAASRLRSYRARSGPWLHPPVSRAAAPSCARAGPRGPCRWRQEQWRKWRRSWWRG